ncbi:hypothetical protein [Nesterenkonia rhizosphaerae]|uniref:HTH marR-type domain-containing protein n=1 Tax=Nesterenkonia rhizosphaerae TaxID=1348272 RepID=A0ABP9FTJ3_9MICC
MNLPTDELLQQYFDDRLALAKFSFAQRLDKFLDANLTMHELRIILLVASGAVTEKSRLIALVQLPPHSVDATLGGLIEHGYLAPIPPGSQRLTPTDEAMDLFDAAADRRDVTMDMLADLAPEDLSALVQGTQALRRAMEEDAQREGGLLSAGVFQQMQPAS